MVKSASTIGLDAGVMASGCNVDSCVGMDGWVLENLEIRDDENHTLLPMPAMALKLKLNISK
jgi:hypothetical protein